MDDSGQPNQQKIVAELQQFKVQGLSFIQAKNELIAQGYSDEEVSQVADNFPYDALPTQHAPDKVEQYFETHPEQAVEDGVDLLKAKQAEDIKEEREQAVGDLAAAELSPRFDNAPTEPQMHFLNRFAFDAGISIWVLLGLMFAINIIAYALVHWLKINSWYYAINGGLTVILIGYLIKRIR